MSGALVLLGIAQLSVGLSVPSSASPGEAWHPGQSSVSSLPVLQVLQGPQPSAGRELAGQQRRAQGEAGAEEGAQTEDHADECRRHRAGPAEQGPGRAVAQGEGAARPLGKQACSPLGLLGPLQF